MISVETPSGIENHDFNYREDIRLTLPISADEILKLNHGNTLLYTSAENPETNCIVIAKPAQEDCAAQVYTIYERDDLIDELYNLGFCHQNEPCSDKHKQAYADWLASQDEGNWAVIFRDGVPLIPDPLEIIPRTFQSSAIVHLALSAGETYKATPENTRLFDFGDNAIESHLRLASRNKVSGEPEWDYLFGVSELMKKLELQGFPITKQPCPSEAAVILCQKWLDKDLDNALQDILSDDENN